MNYVQNSTPPHLTSPHPTSPHLTPPHPITSHAHRLTPSSRHLLPILLHEFPDHRVPGEVRMRGHLYHIHGIRLQHSCVRQATLHGHVAAHDFEETDRARLGLQEKRHRTGRRSR